LRISARSPLPALVTAVLLSACTSSTPYRGPNVTAGREAVETWTEEVSGGRGFRILFRNNSAAPVRITRIELYDCQNVNQACAPFDPGITLRPGQATEALEVGPALRNYEFTFAYRFSWQALTGSR